jgi:hypothetical protein
MPTSGAGESHHIPIGIILLKRGEHLTVVKLTPTLEQLNDVGLVLLFPTPKPVEVIRNLNQIFALFQRVARPHAIRKTVVPK